jgi:hypothetical protein
MGKAPDPPNQGRWGVSPNHLAGLPIASATVRFHFLTVAVRVLRSCITPFCQMKALGESEPVTPEDPTAYFRSSIP